MFRIDNGKGNRLQSNQRLLAIGIEELPDHRRRERCILFDCNNVGEGIRSGTKEDMDEAVSSTEESESFPTRNEIVFALTKALRTDCGTRGLNKKEFVKEIRKPRYRICVLDIDL